MVWINGALQHFLTLSVGNRGRVNMRNVSFLGLVMPSGSEFGFLISIIHNAVFLGCMIFGFWIFLMDIAVMYPSLFACGLLRAFVPYTLGNSGIAVKSFRIESH